MVFFFRIYFSLGLGEELRRFLHEWEDIRVNWKNERAKLVIEKVRAVVVVVTGWRFVVALIYKVFALWNWNCNRWWWLSSSTAFSPSLRFSLSLFLSNFERFRFRLDLSLIRDTHSQTTKQKRKKNGNCVPSRQIQARFLRRSIGWQNQHHHSIHVWQIRH